MPTIIYPPTIDFQWIYQRPQQLLAEIAALGYKVIFYNYDHYIKQNQSIIELKPNFFLCKPELPLYKTPADNTVILWISYPPNIKYLGKFKENIVIFDSIDEASGEFISWAKDLENISKKADVIFATSKKLYNFYSKKYKNVYLCPNGADYNLFNKAQTITSSKPDDMPKNSRPIVGYYGAIASWIDWELVRYISYQNKDMDFVMIGPLYGNFNKIVKSTNIYYLGRKDYTELPQYLQYFDVCIIPFKVTSMIESCNPIKMYEYLSAGKPVVTTSMPETIEIEEIYSARSKQEFSQMLKRALAEKDDFEKVRARIDFARNNSWSHRAAYAARVIDETLKRKFKEVST